MLQVDLGVRSYFKGDLGVRSGRPWCQIKGDLGVRSYFKGDLGVRSYFRETLVSGDLGPGRPG
jgi:hypothetical protein